jgi:hypothetical protein
MTGNPMLLDAPFIPDPDYAAFLAERRGRLHSVYFSLYAEGVPDGRHRFQNLGVRRLADLLKGVEGPKKYGLLNSRFHSPAFYADPGGLSAVLDVMGALLADGVLDGIVYADHYLLNALSGVSPETAAALEAVPSVNFLPETFDGVYVLMESIGETRFKPPGKLTLDRSINRRMGDLAALSGRIRSEWPDLKISLLANEGCLYRCPFKLTHDAHIGMVHLGHDLDTHRINEDLGCMAHLRENPPRLLASPFIRPEDAHLYRDHADILKICGRTLGPAFLRRVVAAYLAGSYDGNLLDLTDAMAWMADEIHVANPSIPDDFAGTVTDCAKTCGACDYCRSVFDACATRVDAPAWRIFERTHRANT